MDDTFIQDFNNPPHEPDEYTKHYRDLFYRWRTPGHCATRYAFLSQMNLNVLTTTGLIQFLLVDDDLAIFTNYFNQIHGDNDILLEKLTERPACAHYYCMNAVNNVSLHDAALQYIMAHNFKKSHQLLLDFWTKCTDDGKLSMLGTTPFLLRSKTFRHINIPTDINYTGTGIAGLLYIGKKINITTNRAYTKFLNSVKVLHELLQDTTMPHLDQDEYYEIPSFEVLLTTCLENINMFPSPQTQRVSWNSVDSEPFKSLDWSKVIVKEEYVLPYDDIHYRFMLNPLFLGMEHIDRQLMEISNSKLYNSRDLRCSVDMWITIISDNFTGLKRSKLARDAVQELCMMIASDIFVDDFMELIEGLSFNVLHKLPLAQELNEINYSAFVLSLVRRIYTAGHPHISSLKSIDILLWNRNSIEPVSMTILIF
jgi:hypothetical protein